MYMAKGTDSQKVLIRGQIGMLSFVLRDLEGHRSCFAAHSRCTSVFLQIVVFDQQVRDVLAGGLARRLSGLADLRVEAEGDLSAEVLFLFHAAVLLPVCCNDSIAGSLRKSYYQHHRRTLNT